jgi:hypothetical protein
VSARIAALSSAAPHLPQKFDIDEICQPHFRQVLTRAFPQCAQKLLSGGFSMPHFRQCIGLPAGKAIGSHLSPYADDDHRGAILGEKLTT